MWIEALEVTNFRNFAEALIRPNRGVNVFYGTNGAGKTNLLEAIFTLCLGRSQRGARDLMMVKESWDEANPNDCFHLEGIGHIDGREVRLVCAYQKNGRKKFTIDNNPARISRLYQFFSLVSMAPEDVSLFTGAPSGRRHFMDLYLSQASPNYLKDLSDYNKALAQKNSYLKNPHEGECPFDPILIECGTRIISTRYKFIHFLRALAPGYYEQIADPKTDRNTIFNFDYAPNIKFENVEKISDNFQAKLNRYRAREDILETAIVGPHRDDLDFNINQFPARGYGSQGELRSATIATLMAVANFLESRRDSIPILLLDEIFAELDSQRRENLASLFTKFDQIFLTSAIEPPQSLLSKAKIFTIKNGRVV